MRYKELLSALQEVERHRPEALNQEVYVMIGLNDLMSITLAATMDAKEELYLVQDYATTGE
jgi:hypothetical protein